MKRPLSFISAKAPTRYGVALLAALVGVWIEHELSTSLGSDAHAFIYPICFFIVTITGFGPACLAILVNALGALALDRDPGSIAKIVVFSITSLVVAAWMDRHRRREIDHRSRAAQLDQEHRARELLDDLLVRSQRSETRLQLAADATGIGIWEHTPETDELYWSRELRKILSIDAAETPTRATWISRIHPEDRAALEAQIARTLDPAIREAYGVDVRTVVHPDGEIRWIRIKGRPYFNVDGSVRRFVGTIEDITDRKNTEHALRVAKDEAVSANSLKSAFLANMSHEIRTPLGAMLGFMDLLRDADLPHEERRRYLDISIRNGVQLNQIINDILDLSKVEAGQLKYESVPIDPRKIVSDVLSLLSVKAAEKRIVLRSDLEETIPVTIVSDPTRLRQILLNIVGNAVKFTPEGHVHVRGWSAEDGVHFEIVDTGTGIPSHQHEAVFQPFVQADSTMIRRFEGTGLGLPLSKKLAQALGGDVVLVSSEPGQGSRFRITVRDQGDAPALAAQDPRPEPHFPGRGFEGLRLSGVRVLLVEDSVDNQELIRHYLAKTGAQIEIAGNGREGVSRASASEHDIVLMDIQMPEMDGYEATETLRRDGYRKPIIALTAHAMVEFRRKSLQVGCTDHLSKPIDRQSLITMIEKHLHR